MRGSYLGRVLHTPTLVLFGADDALLPQAALAVSPDEVARRISAFLELPAA